MDLQNATVAIIPCFNEEQTIGALVRETRRYVPHVFVVDDGSSDSTAAEALAVGVRVLCHRRNLGKGAALHTGLTAALESGFRHAVLLDGDGQHQPGEISNLLACAEKTGAVLVIGNRMHDAHSMRPVRRWVNRGMSAEISRLAGRTLPDTQCGFRLVNLAAWRGMVVHARHFEVESEIVLSFVRRGCRVEFVPIKTVPGRRPSRIRPVRDTARWLRWWLKASGNRPERPPQARLSAACR